MKNYVIVESGTPVELGDVITLKSEETTSVGHVTTTTTFTITPDNIGLLIKEGVVKEVKKTNDKKPSENIVDYVQSLADRLGWTFAKTDSYLEKLDSIYPAAAFSILLKTVARRLDKKYEGHISTSPEIWFVSITNGKVAKADKRSILSYDHFAAFRTKEDAEFAAKVLAPCLFGMFNGKQKDC